jgi:hypothetical protein
MGPLTVLALAAGAVMLGAGLGLSEVVLLRRAGGSLATSAIIDVWAGRLRWLAPAIAGTLTLKTALSSRPQMALAWLPLVVAGPWLVAVLATGVGALNPTLLVATVLTANGVVMTVAFSGSADALLTAPLGMALLAGIAALVNRIAPGLVSLRDAQLAAFVGLATGALGWPAIGLALLCVAAILCAVRALARNRGLPVAPALLAGAWVAAAVVL